MWLKSLHVENFRGFEKLDVTFDEHVTLLIGGNGAGKTAVLEAIKVAFGSYFSKIAQGPTVGIDADDVRCAVFRKGTPESLHQEEQWPVSINAEASLGALRPFSDQHNLFDSLHWTRDREERAGRTSRADDGAMRQLAERVQDQVMRGQDIDLPLLAYYGTQRLWREKRDTAAKRGVGSRLDGYIDCLDIASSQRSLRDWMRQRTLEEVQQQQRDRGYRHPQLRAVIAAVESCMEGISDLSYDLMLDDLYMRVGPTFLSFAMLSDGYRNMIAMVADIAERAAVLNPQHGAAAGLETSGIVLIDEVDLHLHPKWQRSVIVSLRRAFPKMQFIATTHSPQVLASVQRDQVRIFDNNQLVDVAPFVEGRASNELLQDVFDVSARPEATERELDELFHLLDTEDYVAAQAKFSALVGRLGPDDAAMVRARWILDTEGGVKHVAPIAS